MLSVWCGEVVYEQALAWQRQLAEARAADAIDDVLLTLTHDPVYTAGRHADLEHNLLGEVGVRVVEVERGGDLTYHGPGQLVAYPIVKLHDSKAARAYVDALVEACVRTARSYGVDARPDHDRPGVWVGTDKLAAVGVRIANRVTTHGLAFNVDPDLALFGAGIVPCGIRDAGVCSLASLGVDTDLEQVRRRLVAFLAETLGRPVHAATPADLGLVAIPAPAG
jgi:lipoyl(octanoyl) transferase